MKKLLCLLLTVVLCLGILAGCGGEKYDLESAKTALDEAYKNLYANASNDYDLPGKIVVKEVTYAIIWTTDSSSVTIKASTREGYFTVDVPEANATEATYKLTATITDPNGDSVTLELNRTLPVYDNTGVVDPSALKENTAYKMYLEQKNANVNQTLFAIAETESDNKYIKTVVDPKAAPDFYVEIVEGGYKFYTMVGEAKTYVYAKTVVGTDNHVSKYVGYSTTESTVWVYDPIGVFYTVIDAEKYGFGTYGNYKTMSISEYKHFTADSIGNTQYVAKFMEKSVAEALTPSPEPTPTPNPNPSTAPTTGVGYYVSAANANGTIYFKGTVTSGRFDATLTKSEAVQVYLENAANSGEYYLYFNVGTTKTYIVMGDSTTAGDTTTTVADATVFEWNATAKTMVVADDTNNRAFGAGAESTYNNFSAYDVGGSYNWAAFTADGTTPTPTPDPDPDPTPTPTPSGAPEAGIYTVSVKKGGTTVVTLDGSNHNDYAYRWAFGDAAKVTFELVTVNGGYNIKITTNATGVTKYWNIVKVTSGTSTFYNLLAQDTATSVWKWNATGNYLYVTVDGADYTVMQTSTYENVEAKAVTTNGNIFYLTPATAHTHAYTIPATCTVAQSCVCGATTGSTLEHNYVNGTCSCGKTQGTTTVSKSWSDIATIAGVTAGQQTGVIANQTIALDGNISIVCAKGTASTDPCIYSGGIRLYQNGATLTITAGNGATINQVVITVQDNNSGKGPITVTGGTASELTSDKYTITANAGATEIVITTAGTTSTTRLYVANIEVTYAE